ncbi:MAG: hypothetical protein JRD89_02770 [Deltaproteobacteria bacterium]|nr:hypothetical protein [Deltaproteobacteria bacterium]
MTRSRLTSMESGSSIELDVVEEESAQLKNEVTVLPVERGRDISDHVELKPATLTLKGVIAGKDAGTKLTTLIQWREDRHRLRYSGRRVVSNYVIQELSTHADVTIGDGFSFTLKLQQVRVVSASPIKPIGIATQTESEENRGFVQVQTRSGITPTAAGAVYVSGEV